MLYNEAHYSQTKARTMRIMYSVEFFDVRIEKISWKGTLYKYGVKFDKESEMKFFTTIENAKNHIISQKKNKIRRLYKIISDLESSIKKIEDLVVIEEQVIALEKLFTN